MTDSQIQRDGEPEEVELYTIEVNGSPVVISAFEVGDTAGAIAAAANKDPCRGLPDVLRESLHDPGGR
jgi:hypothetical protein